MLLGKVVEEAAVEGVGEATEEVTEEELTILLDAIDAEGECVVDEEATTLLDCTEAMSTYTPSLIQYDTP